MVVEVLGLVGAGAAVGAAVSAAAAPAAEAPSADQPARHAAQPAASLVRCRQPSALPCPRCILVQNGGLATTHNTGWGLPAPEPPVVVLPCRLLASHKGSLYHRACCCLARRDVAREGRRVRARRARMGDWRDAAGSQDAPRARLIERAARPPGGAGARQAYYHPHAKPRRHAKRERLRARALSLSRGARRGLGAPARHLHEARGPTGCHTQHQVWRAGNVGTWPCISTCEPAVGLVCGASTRSLSTSCWRDRWSPRSHNGPGSTARGVSRGHRRAARRSSRPLVGLGVRSVRVARRLRSRRACVCSSAGSHPRADPHIQGPRFVVCPRKRPCRTGSTPLPCRAHGF